MTDQPTATLDVDPGVPVPPVPAPMRPAAGSSVPGVEDERLTTMGLLAETVAGLAARGSSQLADFGLSSVEFEVLLRLARSPAGLLRMTDLTAQTSLTSSGVTRVVDRLCDRGLVTRQACDTDRRTTYAVVTEPGRALLAEILPAHLEFIQAWLIEPLRAGGDESLAAFERALRAVRDHVVPCATAGSDGPFTAGCS